MHDVIVVGAGPAGSLAAKTLAQAQYDVLVLEDHDTPGIPQHCTGLITDETIRMSGVKPDIINTFHSVEFVFPSGQTIRVDSEKALANIVDRVDMEQKMVDAAKMEGVEYSFSNAYQSHTVGDSVVVQSQSGAHKAKILVGADGAMSKIAMSLGENRPKEYIRGIQADVRHTMEDQDTFRIYLGNSVAPGFFAWEIPCGSMTRIGLCASWSAGVPSEYLSSMLIRMGYQDRIVKVYSGKIPLGGRQFLCGDRVILTGDAAGFVKPLSGGGLYPLFKANPHLVSVISAGLDSGALSSRDLAEYERLCKDDFIRDLNKAYKLRKRYKNISDSDFNKIHDIVVKNDLAQLISDMDIDHPAGTIKKMISKPRVFISALPIIMRSIR